MTEFNSAGYEDLRTYLQNNWQFIAVLDDSGTEQLRWEIGVNTNTTWASGPNTNPLTAELTITGQDLIDAGATLPVTLASTEAYKSGTATTVMGSDPITDATVEASGDEVTISHDYEMPTI